MDQQTEPAASQSYDIKDIKFYHAKHEDAEQMLKVVLDAYIVEVGNTGIAFKTKNRYLSIDEVHADINRTYNEKAIPSPDTVYLVAKIKDENGPLVGCIRGVLFKDTDERTVICECGPIAVAPSI